MTRGGAVGIACGGDCGWNRGRGVGRSHFGLFFDVFVRCPRDGGGSFPFTRGEPVAFIPLSSVESIDCHCCPGVGDLWGNGKDRIGKNQCWVVGGCMVGANNHRHVHDRHEKQKSQRR